MKKASSAKKNASKKPAKSKVPIPSKSATAGRVWVGLDLGGTKMLANVFDDQYRVLGRAKQKTQGAKGARAGLKRMVDTVSSIVPGDGVKLRNRCASESRLAISSSGSSGLVR